MVNRAASIYPLTFKDPRPQNARHPAHAQSSSGDVKSLLAQFKSDPADGINQPELFKFVVKNCFESAHENSGSKTSFALLSDSGYNYFLRFPVSGKFAASVSQSLHSQAFALLGKINAQVNLPRDLVNYLKYQGEAEKVVSELAIIVAKALQLKTEFNRAPAAVNALIAISQARGQDPGILLPDAFVWVAKTQLGLTPGLAARSIEVLCSVFDPKLGYNVFEAVGDLYKCVPTPKAVSF